MKSSNLHHRFDKDAEQARDSVTLSQARLSGGLDALVNFSSQWQHERKRRIHLICKLIKSSVEKGESRHTAITRFSRKWNRKPLRCDPSRQYALSVAQLYRHYRRWQLGGEIPSVFQLQYRPINRRIPAPVLVRFIELCAAREFPSFRSAWEVFCRRGGNFGPGRVNGRKLKLGYHSLRWNLPRGSFSEFKHCWQTIRKAQKQIQMLRIEFTAQIRANVADRVPRRRVKREPDFEI